MSKPTTITLVGVALTLTVLGCRNEERTSRPDEMNSPGAMPETEELDPPMIEDEDAIGDEDDAEPSHDHHGPGSAPEVPTAGEPETDPVDPDMPEAVDPGADPKQPPPPSEGRAGS